jgi:hypothetical protein
MQKQKSPISEFPHPRSREHDAASLTGWRHHLWLALLVCASVAFSLGFACATPFAAFSTAAALTLNRRDAMLLTGAVWLANQFVGFIVLRYPWTITSFAWGFAIGAAAIVATLAARWTACALNKAMWTGRSLAAFAAAFAVFEGVLFMVALVVLGGTEDFTPPIVAWIFAVNASALIGLFVLNRLAMVIGLIPKLRARPSITEQRA